MDQTTDGQTRCWWAAGEALFLAVVDCFPWRDIDAAAAALGDAGAQRSL